MGDFKLLTLLSFLFVSCTKKPAPDLAVATMYFPPNNSATWEGVAISSLGWNESAIQPLRDFLKSTNTKSFMILINGRIAMEEYFNGQTASDTWEWNSAGKTLVAATIGIAQQEGFLNLNDRVSKYLGPGWSAEPLEKENLITIRNLLTMTSGLDDTRELVIKANLTYVADAGTRWAYSNVFQLLMNVISEATNQSFQDYFRAKIGDPVGMQGIWNFGIVYKIYHSDARSMARFGLLALNHGNWDGHQIIPEEFFRQSVASSQSINPSYGYFWWLNGKTSYMLPAGQNSFAGSLIPNASATMFSAMGANDQRIYVVPEKKMVVIRMGEASDPDNPAFAASGFDSALWNKLNAVVR